MKKLVLILIILGCAGVSAHPSLHIRRGLELLEEGRLEEAEKELQLARFIEPENAVIKYNLGHVCYRKRKYSEAADLFAEAVRLTPDKELMFKSLHNLGNASYRLGQYAMAVDAFKRGLEIKHDARTEYNLKQAEEKLKEKMQKQNQQNQEQQNQQNQQNQEQQNQQNQQNQQDQKQQDQQGQDQNQQNQSGQDGQNENKQQNADAKDSQKKQNGENDKNKEKSGEDGQNNEPQQGGQQQQQEQAQKDSEGDQTGEAKEEQKREDVKMAEGGSEKEKPQESQRARAIKNRSINPYMVEKLMRQMQEREKEAQLYYRNEQAQRQEEMDPFNMDARQLQEFFRNRGRKTPQPSNEPDW